MGLGLRTGRGFLDAASRTRSTAYNPAKIYLYSITPKWGGSVRQMESFIEESRRSPMSDKDKARLESNTTPTSASTASGQRYMSSSEHYLKAYQLQNDAKWLYRSGKSAMDGGFKDLALSRFNELIEAHPKYERGYTQRGFLYETNYKNNEKASRTIWSLPTWEAAGHESYRLVVHDRQVCRLGLRQGGDMAEPRGRKTKPDRDRNLRNLEKLRRADHAK